MMTKEQLEILKKFLGSATPAPKPKLNITVTPDATVNVQIKPVIELNANEAALYQQALLLIDPLVCDTSCHIRATLLAGIFQKIEKNRTLSLKDNAYLRKCGFLTFTKIENRDKFGIIVDQQFKAKAIPKELLTACNIKLKEINSFCIHGKLDIADLGLDALFKASKDLIFEDGLEYYKSKTINLKISDKLAPVIPCYIACKMMLHYLARKKIPIIINLKRFQLIKKADETRYELNGAITLCYRYSDEHKKFMLLADEIKPDEAGVTLECFSAINDTIPVGIEEFFAAPNFNDFLNNFKKYDIAKLLLIGFVGHSQLPGMATLEDRKKLLMPASTRLDIKPEEVTIDLNKCSIREFQKFYELAIRHGLTLAQHHYAHVTDQIIHRTPNFMPFMPIHAYNSNYYNSSAITQQVLTENAKEKISLPLDEKVMSLGAS